ncbi:MAG: MFS transporter [Anaerolineaceae bacterium]
MKPSVFSVLRYPNYRLWFFGQLLSLVGTWMQTTAQGYLVFQLTGSPAYLGYVAFANGLPSWLFTLYGGVIADRMSRRNIIIVAQSFMMVLAFILAGLVYTGIVLPWHIILLSFLLGIANAFDAPARQSFVIELVDREELSTAIALNSTMFNSAAVVGPVVAATTYAAIGPVGCFTINGLSFIAVIVGLALMKMKKSVRPLHSSSSLLIEAKEGLKYTWGQPVIRMLIMSLMVLTALGMGLVALIPAWAVDVLKGDVTTNGSLFSARGVGAMCGALLVALLTQYRIKGKIWGVGLLLQPFFILAFALSTSLPLSMLFLAFTGLTFLATVNTTNAMVQELVTDDLRGRVMGIYTLTFLGTVPIGSLVAGLLADSIGEQTTVIIFGSLMLLFSGYSWVRMKMIRQVP